MDKLTLKRKDQLTQKLSGSISQFLKEKKLELEKAKDVILLLDVSGSMEDMVGGIRKIDSLRKAVDQFPHLQRVAFSKKVSVVSVIPEPQSSTDMAGAFLFLEGLRPSKVIVISDGLPDSPNLALKTAKSLGAKIDVIYIGPGGDQGEAFMKLLASQCGGSQVTVEPQKAQQIASGIKGLIG